MSKYDVIIIGGGLGGLLCANILSREGMSVCLVEKNTKLGGCIQSFAKNKTLFNTGLNYTESLGEGEVLNQYFKYFGVMDKLKIKQLDKDAYNKVSFDNDPLEYPFAQGHENFVDQLVKYFPNSRENLQNYIQSLAKICNSFPLYTFDNSKINISNENLYGDSAYEYLKTIDKDYKLQQVLAGMNSLYGGVADKTPLYVHAIINYSFIKSTWRFVDGSSQLSGKLSDEIKSNGGEVHLSTKVTSIGGSDKKAQFIELENGEKLYADKIISSMHPSTTLKIVAPEIQKKHYASRIHSLENTIGMFTVYLVMKKDSFPYLNYNIHHYNSDNAWTSNYNEKTWPEHYYMYTPATSKSDKFTDGVIAMSYMNYNEVKQWENTFVENRGEDYLSFKQHKAEQLIKSIEKKFPDIRKHIECYYTSTPLTYRDYTGTPEGTSYGILKNYNDPLSTIITPRSRIKNLYFTGQNLNMHGILGVTISSVLTCSEFLGLDYLVNKIKKK